MAYVQLGQAPQAFPRCDGISNFRAVVRKLWANHVVWTRQYILSVLASAPDQDAALQRLLANQDAIGQSVVSFLGPETGLRLSKLLREHILIAGKLVSAVHAKDQPAVAVHEKEWMANGVEIVTLLNKANPRWPLKTLQEMWQHHLDLTTRQIAARLKTDWTGDVAAFDAGFDHMMKFADFMANGMLAIVMAATRRK